MEKEKIYYIYIYLDPRKSGKYKYDINGKLLVLDYEPIYVGKGKDNRYEQHWGLNDLSNKFFERKLWKIKRKNLIPTIFIRENLTEDKAYKLEKTLIKIIGRNDFNEGPLCNHTKGGDGNSGKRSEELKKKQSELMKNLWNSERRKNHSKIMKKKWKNPEFKKAQCEIRKEMWENNPDSKKTKREALQKLWKDPDFRKKESKLRKKLWNPERKRKHSEVMKEKWKDPEYRKKKGV